MKLSKLFLKPVDRTIEGVIKADDDQSLLQEVEEYVLTNEIEKRFDLFLKAYNEYDGANGVWISGFFGSGKSHLLKMLALLLENRQIDGRSVLDMFLPKCSDDLLKGDIKRAVSIPSKSILFNIDQKADVISKTQVDALLSVFEKVFDEMCGYYGKQGHIAEFERNLDERGLLDKFKESYKSIAGNDWEFGREQYILEAENIARAYAETTNTDEEKAHGILDKYRKDYKVSIEDFANQVNKYIEKQGPGFRLNFFVDEVGQYIAGNVKLMTNLQTVAESLATKCRGRAWLIVTAQEDLESVIGDVQSSNDFSKIQDRFKNRLKLTSANVSEVIQKRLLSKNDQGKKELKPIYQEQCNNFKTLFDFADGAKTYRNFKDEDHFVSSYPFIPYQFDLFQTSIINLSQHQAFEGKHSSVGERSMLGVFQHVAVKISDKEVGQLATFDLMYEGIRTVLKGKLQHSINQAEKNLENPFAIKLLKALFLVKYVKDYRATVRNLCVLMIDHFNQNMSELKEKVTEALNLLEQQTYIQRNGELYEFLTDEERDVESEIKETEVEASDVADQLGSIIFDNIIRERKIRFDESKQDYSFSKKLDDKLIGREYELAIHIASPFNEYCGSEKILQAHSMERDELLVSMPPDERLYRDIILYKQTEKFCRQNISITQKETVKTILSTKITQNRQRLSELELRLKNSINQSKLYVAGRELDISNGDAQSKVIAGFYELIKHTYPNLRMLQGMNYSQDDLVKFLKYEDGLFDDSIISEAEQEVLSVIQSNARTGIRTTLKAVVDKFEHKPYGWLLYATLCMLAKLGVRGKIEVRSDSNVLENEDLKRAFLNTQGYPNVILTPQMEFTASQVRQLKEFYQDFFDTPPQANETKALGKETSDKLETLYNELNKLSSEISHYPFKQILDAPLQLIKQLKGKIYAFYLTDFKDRQKELLDLKEKVLDPLRKFMSGSQRQICDEALKYCSHEEANFQYCEADELPEMLEILKSPDCFKGNSMQKVKDHMEVIKAEIDNNLAVVKLDSSEHVAMLKFRMEQSPDFQKLTPEQQSGFQEKFAAFIRTLENYRLIAVIRDNLRTFEEVEYNKILTRIGQLTQPPETDTGGETPGPVIEIIPLRRITIPFDKALLVDEADVKAYTKSMSDSMLEEIRKGKRIQI